MLLSNYSLIFLINAFGATTLGILAWNRRMNPARTGFVLVMLAGAIWSVARFWEAVVIDIPDKIFWAKLEYLGIATLAPCWFVFASSYTQRSRWIQPRVIRLLFILPVITILAAWTNDWHHLIWTHIYPSPDAGSEILVYEHGLWFYTDAFYNYVLILAGITFLVKTIASTQAHYRRQVWFVLIGSIISLLSNFIYLLGLSPIKGLDLTPLSFSVSGFVYMIGFFNLGLLDLVPVARHVLVEEMTDGVVVIDLSQRIVDINPAASKMLDISASAAIGQNMETIFLSYPSIFLAIQTEENLQLDVPGDKTHRTLDVRITDLTERNNLSGRLVVMRDISELKSATEAVIAQRTLAEALRDTAAALNSTLDLDDLLDKILENVGKVVPHDVSGILMINEQGEAYLVREQGYPSKIMARQARTLRLQVDKTPNLLAMKKEGSYSLIPDSLLDSNWIRIKGDKLRSYLGAPIKVRDRVVGFITVQSLTPNYYTASHGETLVSFANQAGLAIQNAGLYDHIQHHASQLEMLHKVGLSIASGLEMKEVLQNILEQSQKVLNFDIFYIGIYHPQTRTIDFPIFYENGRLTNEFNEVSSLDERPGIVHFIIQNSRTVNLPDVDNPMAASPAPVVHLGGTPARSFVGVPILLGEKILGIISIQSYKPEAFSEEQVTLLETIAAQAAVALENARLYAEVQRLNLIDELTRVFNFRGLMEIGLREFERSRRLDHPLAILFIDIDDFHDFNNTYNHATGNLVLQAVANNCKTHTRSIDLVARFGGDEFIILLPETQMADAVAVAGRICQGIAESRVTTAEWGELGVTVSIGVARIEKNMQSFQQLIDLADQAEHLAKEQGRNRVLVAN